MVLYTKYEFSLTLHMLTGSFVFQVNTHYVIEMQLEERGGSGPFVLQWSLKSMVLQLRLRLLLRKFPVIGHSDHVSHKGGGT